MMMTFITRRGEGQGRTKKGRKATKSEGSGLEEGARLWVETLGPDGPHCSWKRKILSACAWKSKRDIKAKGSQTKRRGMQRAALLLICGVYRNVHVILRSMPILFDPVQAPATCRPGGMPRLLAV